MRSGLLVLTLCVAAPLQVATAQESAPPSEGISGQEGVELRQRWPEALHYRNARYANLEREIDTPGDQREAVLVDLYLARHQDLLGDREQIRQLAAARHVPPRATQHARVVRDLNLGDDEGQQILAFRTRARHDAELRRFRDLGGDEIELALHWEDRLQHGPLIDPAPQELIVEQEEDEGFRFYIFTREDTIHSQKLQTLRDMERRMFDLMERRDEVGLAREEEAVLRDIERAHARLEAELERQLDEDIEQAEGDLERDFERDAEKQEEDVIEEAEGDLERAIESEEAALERALDRALQQAEEERLEDE
jgi:hypothetical protein